MDKPEFVYTTYIRTTPQRLWEALTDPAFTRRYWSGLAFESDWKTGSTVTLKTGDGTVIADPEQVVLEPTPTGAWPTPGTPSPPAGPRLTKSTRRRARDSPPSPAPRSPSTSKTSGTWSS
jgi:hypothetical protein